MEFSGFAIHTELPIKTISPKRLNLEAVKNLAREEKLKLISFSEKSRVISFRKSVGNVRINVYWTTGTVGTCLDHPRQGKTQLFRRNVDLPTLREIFQNPRLHTGSGYHTKENVNNAATTNTKQMTSRMKFCVGDKAHVRGSADGTIVSKRLTSGNYEGKIEIRHDDGRISYVKYEQLEEVSEIHDDNQCLTLENEAKRQLERLDNELQKIQTERVMVQEILQDIEHKKELKRKRKEAEAKAERERIAKKREEELKRKAEAEAKAERERIAKKRQEEMMLLDSNRNARGKFIDYCLYQSDHVEECFNETVISMACGGNATILFYEGGGWAWTSGLPKQLHNKLNGRQRTLPSPNYVAMGSQDRYYVKFEDGKSEWVGCDNMTNLLQGTNRTVKTVAFGEDWDTYFVVFADGGWNWGGTIPYALSDLLGRRNKKGDLECVSLGPAGEYYLKAKNGRAWWGGMTTENLATATKHRDRIEFMDFGDDDTFFLRYS